LDELLGRVAGRFARVEPRRRAKAFVLGLLADLPRENCWTIAEHVATPALMGCSTCSAGRCGTTTAPAMTAAPDRQGLCGLNTAPRLPPPAASQPTVKVTVSSRRGG
jgi:hypothetical protein